jgi:hypothetical protein
MQTFCYEFVEDIVSSMFYFTFPDMTKDVCMTLVFTVYKICMDSWLFVNQLVFLRAILLQMFNTTLLHIFSLDFSPITNFYNKTAAHLWCEITFY